MFSIMWVQSNLALLSCFRRLIRKYIDPIAFYEICSYSIGRAYMLINVFYILRLHVHLRLHAQCILLSFYLKSHHLVWIILNNKTFDRTDIIKLSSMLLLAYYLVHNQMFWQQNVSLSNSLFLRPTQTIWLEYRVCIL